MVFGFSLPLYLKKNVVRVGPPLAKLSGSAHARSSLSGDDSLYVKLKLQCNACKGTIVPSQEAPKIGPLSVVTDSGPSRLDAGWDEARRPGEKSQYLAIVFFFRNTSYGKPMTRIATNCPGFIVTISKTGNQGINRTKLISSISRIVGQLFSQIL